MINKKTITKSADETMALAQKFSKTLKPGDIICLKGDLGTGKTTFVKGLAKGLGASAKEISSPTFVLMNVYKTKLPLYHFDLYRLDDISEILKLGYEEFFYGQGVAVIEWSEKLGKLMPEEYIDVTLKHIDIKTREIRFSYFKRH